MFNPLKDRLDILKRTLPHPLLLVAFGVLQAMKALPILLPTAKIHPQVLKFSLLTPWYYWVIGWLSLLWLGSIEYSLQRKQKFDNTSLNFFKAFLDFLIKEGHKLFSHSEEKDFYSKINDWQHMVIEGIAIGLGHEESQKYFQKMDTEYPLTKATKESSAQGNNEPLCKALQGNLEALETIRLNLTETKVYEKGELETVKKRDSIGTSFPQLPAK